ncbi:alcohol dehydrogenase catalytic domain-containing protein [Fluviibacterium sp. DFM31]|uniref:Alcohol dehydrogenase catalytic domain-containing protein n=1 Tax=Meridianimarinicoccus marinus TaxID=3231483 RepID=A0ABV3L9W0_9RHOB
MLGVTKRSEAYGDVGLVDRPDPVAKPGTVVLKTAGAGICGTDLHIFRNEYAVAPPVVMGHEVCGHVVAVGEGVDSGLIGQRFVAESFYSTCGTCRHCRTGRTNLCHARMSIGSHVDGAMAPLVEVPLVNLHPAPGFMSDAAASLAEPVACVTNSLYGDAAYVEPGDDVLVIGPGAIGLIAGQVARLMGGNVTLRGTENDTPRLDAAGALGFAVSVVGEDLAPDRFDVAVECSGNQFGYADALRFLTKGGHLAQMGLSGKDSSLPTDLICYKELTLTSGFASNPRSWRRAMTLMHSGKLDLESLVSEVVPLSQWKRAFDRSFAADGIKFVIDPRLDEA